MITRSLRDWLFPTPWKNRKSLRPRRRPQRFVQTESLEDRTLLAGAVTAELVNGRAVIRGDNANNVIQIAVEDGDLVLIGLEGTLINGQSRLVAQEGETEFEGDLDIDLGKGLDTVVFTEGLEITGNVSINDRRDGVLVGARGVTIDGNLSVKSRRGDNIVWMEDSEVTGKVTVKTRSGDDYIDFTGSVFGEGLTLETGSGHAGILIDDSEIEDGLWLKTGSRADSILLRSTTIGGNLRGYTKGGDDFFMFEDVEIAGLTKLKMYGGNDTVVAEGTNDFGGSVYVAGMAGRYDAVQASDDTTFGGNVSVPKFDVFSVSDAVIDDRLNNDEYGLDTIAEAIMEAFDELVGEETDEIELSIETDQNDNTIQSRGTVTTREETFRLTGVTEAGATVAVDSDGDGQFDDGTTTASASGEYTLDVELEEGAQTLTVRATSTSGETAEEEVNVHLAVGTVVRFTTAVGPLDFELLDDDAPETVENFLAYLDRYEDSVIHRSVTEATAGITIIQGGGFVLDGTELVPIETDAPIDNEFDADNSNVEGTLSMALPAGQPNGGTSQWFINVTDNTELDAALHTVFGRVIGTGMEIIDQISSFPVFNMNPVYDEDNGALSTLPLNNYTPLTQPITGTLQVQQGSTTVTGTGTSFTTELEVGSTILIGTLQATVTAITNNTQLTIATPATTNLTDSAARTNAKPTASQLVLFPSVEEIL